MRVGGALWQGPPKHFQHVQSTEQGVNEPLSPVSCVRISAFGWGGGVAVLNAKVGIPV